MVGKANGSLGRCLNRGRLLWIKSGNLVHWLGIFDDRKVLLLLYSASVLFIDIYILKTFCPYFWFLLVITQTTGRYCPPANCTKFVCSQQPNCTTNYCTQSNLIYFSVPNKRIKLLKAYVGTPKCCTTYFLGHNK